MQDVRRAPLQVRFWPIAAGTQRILGFMETGTNWATPTAATYERARRSRDARFDGQFFVGVRTTGIYCRPICPASLPQAKNVAFFPSAAAAGEAGFRPCLRCRPEAAPGTPAWHGTSTTVRRGLRLIANGALEDGNVDELADRLGVTARHLRRLFHRHLGASPLAIAHTQRLHFAKRLIDETDLPFQAIAAAAGYRSVRRFNDAFLKSYGRAPRELRRRPAAGRSDAPLSVRLSYRRPFDFAFLLEFLGNRSLPGAEAVVDGTYARSIRIGGTDGLLELRQADRREELVLSVYGIPTAELLVVVRRVRELFDLDAPASEIGDALATDPLLAPLVRSQPGIRVPGAWDGFELAVRAVLGQQVSVAAARTLAGRLVARAGRQICGPAAERAAGIGIDRVFPDASALATADLDGLGIVGSRLETIRVLARASAAGDISLDADADPGAVRAALTRIRGIGRWTADYIAMRALREPDAFPAADLGLLRAMEGLAGVRPTPAALAARSDAWRPWRAYAALLLWSSDANSGG